MMDFKILITNDDGIHAPGIKTLNRAISTIPGVETIVVAPSEEASWSGKGVSVRGEVTARKIEIGDNEYGWSIASSGHSPHPADCVILGYYHLSDDTPPDLILSGINAGANAGSAFSMSSGTIGACFEASLIGIPSIAISLFLQSKSNVNETDFEFSANFIKKFIGKIIHHDFDLDSDIISVNIPFNASDETQITVCEMAHDMYYGCIFEEINRKNDDEITYKLSGRRNRGFKMPQNQKSDFNEVLNGKITITPLKISLTGDYQKLKDKWDRLVFA